MAWIAPVASIVGGIAGGLLGKGSKGTPSTTEPVLLDPYDAERKKQLYADYDAYKTTTGSAYDVKPWEGAYGAPQSPEEAAAIAMLGRNYSPTYTPEERDIYEREMDFANLGKSDADVQALIDAITGESRRAFQGNIGDMSLQANLYGSAGGGQSQTAMGRAASDMASSLATTTSGIRFNARESDRNRALTALDQARLVSQNPWERALQQMQANTARAGTLGEIGYRGRELTQSALDKQIEDYYRNEEYQRYGDLDMQERALKIGMDILTGTRKEIGQRTSGGTAGTQGNGAELGYEIGQAAGGYDWSNQGGGYDSYGRPLNNQPGVYGGGEGSYTGGGGSPLPNFDRTPYGGIMADTSPEELARRTAWWNSLSPEEQARRRQELAAQMPDLWRQYGGRAS